MATIETLNKISFAKLQLRALKNGIEIETMTKRDLIIEIMAKENSPVIEIVENDEIEIVENDETEKTVRCLNSRKTVRSAIRHALDSAINSKEHTFSRTLKSASGEIEITILALKGEINFSDDNFSTKSQTEFYAHTFVTLSL